MDILDRVNQTLSDAGQKSRDLADTVSLNNKIANNKSQMKKLYEELGQKYYDAHKSDSEPAFQELIDKISDLQAQNDDWDDQIKELKGYGKCPYCGGVITDKDAVFCPHCGANLENQAEAEPEGAQGPEADEELSPGEIRCKCGNILKEDEMFCQQCGTSREELEQS